MNDFEAGLDVVLDSAVAEHKIVGGVLRHPSASRCSRMHRSGCSTPTPIRREVEE
jgi:hypothetical protein